MNYIEVTFTFSETFPGNDILPALLTEIDFESFVENDLYSTSAYISEKDFSEKNLIELLETLPEKIEYKIVNIPDQDWNDVWEKNFTAIQVTDNCRVRAPFHIENKSVEYDLIIDPKMSFGTAHHETTFQMIQLLLEEDVKEKIILDMGCGTGVLAILADKMGAQKVVAIDNDEWAYRNSVENIRLNHVSNTEAFLGDAQLLGKEKYDIILANITRNILLNDMKIYCDVLKKGGVLFLSGFFVEDNNLLIEESAKYGVVFKKAIERNNWSAMKLIKHF